MVQVSDYCGVESVEAGLNLGFDFAINKVPAVKEICAGNQ